MFALRRIKVCLITLAVLLGLYGGLRVVELNTAELMGREVSPQAIEVRLEDSKLYFIFAGEEWIFCGRIFQEFLNEWRKSVQDKLH